MRVKRVLAVGVVVVLCLCAPALAGTVYVSLAADLVIDGIAYDTVLKVTNPDDSPHFFVTHFIPTFENGVTRDEAEEPSQVGVTAGRTFVFTNLAGSVGRSGMLEVTGDDELVFDAVLVPKKGTVESPGAEIPIIDSSNLIAGGQLQVVQGLVRDARRVSSYAVINLSQEANRCDFDLFSAGGESLLNHVVLTLPPLSQSYWPDILGIVGVASAAEARFEVSCAADSFSFSQVVDREALAATTLRPSVDLRSALAPPGSAPTAGPCAETSVCVDLPGTFHVATPDHKSYVVKIPMETGRTFKRIDIEVTIVHGGWNNRVPDGIHNVFWLFSNHKFANVTWAYANARGPNRNLLTLSHNINLGKANNRRVEAFYQLVPGTTYTVRYSYDTVAHQVTASWYSASGVLLATMSDATTANRVFFEGDEGFELWFGINGAHEIEVPSLGWQYRDAHIEFSN